MRLIREFVSATRLALCGTLLMVGCTPPQESTPADAPQTATPAVAAIEPEVGPQLPASEVLPEVLSVNTAKLGGLLDRTEGKVTVLNIWATWCGPCVQEMPDIVTFYHEMDRDAVAFVSVSLDAESDITKAISKFQRAHKVPFPIYVLNETNPEGLKKALRGTFRGGIPTTFFYDRTGKLVKMVEGAIPMTVLQGTVKSLVEAQP